MPSPPWFRFYSETLSDRKIDRICRITEQPKCLIVGAWATLMSLANDSPIRGALLLTEDFALSVEDIADEMGLPVNSANVILEEFQRFDMLHIENGIYWLTNWDKRQFASDTSTERVRRYRERQAEQDEDTATDATETPESEECNGDETLHGRYGNAPDTDTETDTEQIQRQNRKDIAAKAASVSSSGDGRSPPGLTEGQRYWLDAFGAKRFANTVQKEAVLALERTYGTETLKAGVQWAAKQGMNMGRAVTALETALKKWDRPKNNGSETVTVKGL